MASKIGITGGMLALANKVEMHYLHICGGGLQQQNFNFGGGMDCKIWVCEKCGARFKRGIKAALLLGRVTRSSSNSKQRRRATRHGNKPNDWPTNSATIEADDDQTTD